MSNAERSQGMHPDDVAAVLDERDRLRAVVEATRDAKAAHDATRDKRITCGCGMCNGVDRALRALDESEAP